MTEQRVSDEEAEFYARVDCINADDRLKKFALDLLDARARVKVLEKIIRAEGFCPDGQILAEMCGCETCCALRGEGVGE